MVCTSALTAGSPRMKAEADLGTHHRASCSGRLRRLRDASAFPCLDERQRVAVNAGGLFRPFERTAAGLLRPRLPTRSRRSLSCAAPRTALDCRAHPEVRVVQVDPHEPRRGVPKAIRSIGQRTTEGVLNPSRCRSEQPLPGRYPAEPGAPPLHLSLVRLLDEPVAAPHVHEHAAATAMQRGMHAGSRPPVSGIDAARAR